MRAKSNQKKQNKWLNIRKKHENVKKGRIKIIREAKEVLKNNKNNNNNNINNASSKRKQKLQINEIIKKR